MPADPGRANERTALGWQRSSLSLAVVAALLLAHAVHRREPLGVATALVVGAGGAWVGALGRRLYARRRAAPSTSAARPLRVVAAITVAAALVAAGQLLGGS
jgi:uncharacterized membrane protein YidH (DUF202 family)